MPSKQKSYAQEYLELIHSGSKCSWCKHPREKVYRAGLCSHCYRISRGVAKLESKVEAYKRQNSVAPFDIENELGVARRMVESAKVEGITYQNLHLGGTDGLDLEHEFSFLSKKFVRKDFFYGEANLFDWCFTPVQKSLIFYFLSLMSREYLRRNRRQMAQYWLEE